MLNLHLSIGVLVHRERVDDTHRVALLQSLQLGDDLAVELGVVKPQHDELNRPDRHGYSLRRLSWRPSCSPRPRRRASSNGDDLAAGSATVLGAVSIEARPRAP
jgi:hypothetical protein